MWGRSILVATFLQFALALAAGGCLFYDSGWYQESESQRRQAAALTPGEVRAEGGPPPARVREVRVRVWASTAYRAEVHEWQRQLAELFDRANAVLGPALGIRLVATEAKRWSVGDGAGLGDVLDALEAHDDGRGVDLVLGMVGSTPHLATDMEALGMARVHGAHLVVRAMNDAAELDAIEEAFDRLSEEEQRRMRRRRKEHKELVVLLHEIGHAYGAIHVRGSGSILSSHYDPEMDRFAPHTVALLRPAVAGRAVPEEQRDWGALKAELAEVLRSHPNGWLAEPRQALLSALESPAAHESPAAGDGSPPERRAFGSAAVATAADPGALPEDVAGLSEDDREAVRRARSAVREGRSAEAWVLLEVLVERHPGVYSIQELACGLFNDGVASREAATACERMMELAMRSGAGD